MMDGPIDVSEGVELREAPESPPRSAPKPESLPRSAPKPRLSQDPSFWSLARRATVCARFGDDADDVEEMTLLSASAADLFTGQGQNEGRCALIDAVIAISPIFGRALIFLGGYASFSNRRAQFVYNACFRATQGCFNDISN